MVVLCVVDSTMNQPNENSNITNSINNVEIQQSDFNSTVRTRNEMETGRIYNKYPTLVSVPRSLRQDFSRILDKPVLVKTVQWTTARNAHESIAIIDFPEAALINEVARVPFRTSCLYRTKMCAYIQVTGTPQHQGTLLASALPFPGVLPTSLTMNTYLQAPHIFLSANESTPVCLEIPFYSNTKLRRCNYDSKQWAPDTGINYASLCIVCVNPLAAPTSGSSAITLSVHVKFVDSEFYVPANDYMELTAQSSDRSLSASEVKIHELELEIEKLKKSNLVRNCLSCICIGYKAPEVCETCMGYSQEVLSAQSVISKVLDMVADGAKNLTGDYIDKGRSLVRGLTGLHNPNHPFIQERMLHTHRNFANSVDIPTYFEKLDPYANKTNQLLQEPTYYTDTDEMLLANILSKPQYIGTFNVTTAMVRGAPLWARPITPIQERLTPTKMAFSTPLQKFAYMSRYWSGTIRLHLQAVMTNFHCCKLAVIKNYTADPALNTMSVNLEDLVNLQVETLEFSAGGQIQTIDLPFCSPLEEIPVIPNQALNALSHGQYFIRLAQPLVFNGSVSTTVNFNVYISAGPDFNFYGYGIERLQAVNGVTFTSDSPGISEERRKVLRDAEQKAKEKEEKIRKQLEEKEKEKEKLLEEEAEKPLYIDNTGKKHYAAKTLKAQASALVIPSVQGDLLNSPPDTVVAPSRKFQPILSVRDHMRRFITGPSFKLINGSNKELYLLQEFAVREIFKHGYAAITRVGPSRIVRDMFLGQSGGYKIKAIVSGAQNVSVRYLPPGLKQDTDALVTGLQWHGGHGITTNGPSIQPVLYSAMQYPYHGNGSLDDKNPCPIIESSQAMANEYTVGATGSSTATSNLSQFQVEMEIPHMNPCEFVGSGANILIPDGTDNFTDDMGHIIISYKNDYIPGQALLPVRPTVTFMMAYADEARLGFNVYSPAVTPDYITQGAEAVYTGPYQAIDGYTRFETSISAPNTYFG